MQHCFPRAVTDDPPILEAIGRELPMRVQDADERPIIFEPDGHADGERTARSCHRALQELFGLTPAEASLAARIPGSRGLQALSDDLGLSLSTVRTHLQRVFEKTGTHRQAELVQLLSELSLMDDGFARSNGH